VDDDSSRSEAVMKRFKFQRTEEQTKRNGDPLHHFNAARPFRLQDAVKVMELAEMRQRGELNAISDSMSGFAMCGGTAAKL
jgi:hypothetical protein